MNAFKIANHINILGIFKLLIVYTFVFQYIDYGLQSTITKQRPKNTDNLHMVAT